MTDDLDPRILLLAQEAVRDLVSEVGRSVIEGRQEALTLRLAKAMQQAIEQEYEALVQELDTRAERPAVVSGGTAVPQPPTESQS